MDAATNNTDDQIAKCAYCNNAADNLKICRSCKLVQYCGVDCQKSHWRNHKPICKKRAAEIHDDELFKTPPPRKDCLICFLPMPHKGATYMTCCGRILCNGCTFVIAAENPICPFCREAIGDDSDKSIQKLNSRMAKNDPEAFVMLGDFYRNGSNGLPEDHEKAFELYTKAADLGSIIAHRRIGACYYDGKGTTNDVNKAKYYFEIAAMKGDTLARYNLGVYEIGKENFRRACRHFIIAAKVGDVDAMDHVRSGYKEGFVTKEEFEETLRSFQKSCDEMKSEQRERAASRIASRGL
jgi:hypothetical protein